MKKFGKFKLFEGDFWIWVCFLMLSIVSAVAVYSSIGQVAAQEGSTPFRMWVKHLIFIGGSWVLAALISHVNYRRFARTSAIHLLASVIALGALWFMGGRWFRLGSFSIQPSEFAKLFLVVSFAKLLATNTDKLQEKSFFGLLIGIMGVVGILIVKENFSTAAMVSLICFFMMLFGGVNFKYWIRTLTVVVVIAGGFLFFSYKNYAKTIDETTVATEMSHMDSKSQTWSHRVYTWVKGDTEEINQINIAHMAVARGGFSGKGPGNTVHARLMTQSHSDFIYSIIIEEWGLLVGGYLIVFIYAFLCFRCIRMSNRCKGAFGSLLVGGLGTYIFVQALVHISYNVGLLPVTGQTLPLISHGGSSYLVFGCAMGIIQSVCSDVRKNERAKREQQERQRGFEETYQIAKEENK